MLALGNMPRLDTLGAYQPWAWRAIGMEPLDDLLGDQSRAELTTMDQSTVSIEYLNHAIEPVNHQSNTRHSVFGSILQSHHFYHHLQPHVPTPHMMLHSCSNSR